MGRLFIFCFSAWVSSASEFFCVSHFIVTAQLCSLSRLFSLLRCGRLVGSLAGRGSAVRRGRGQSAPFPVPASPACTCPPPAQPPGRFSAAAAASGEPLASAGGAGPSAFRRTSGRGGLFFPGNRPLPPPPVPIQKVNVSKDKDLKLTVSDRRRLRTGVAFAINQILRSTASFCTHPEDRQRAAVLYLEDRVPRLALCESAWGACAVLSRGLRHQRIQARRKTAGSGAVVAATTAAAPSAAAAAAGTGGCAAETTGGGDGNDAMSARGQQLAFFSQLEK